MMLKEKKISRAIKQFVALYNSGKIPEACEFYAHRCYQTDGENFATSRDQVIKQLQEVTKESESKQIEQILVNNTKIVIAPDREIAMVWVDFTVGDGAAVAVLMLKWIDDRPQVIVDLTMS